jgi:hypothetical protein
MKLIAIDQCHISSVGPNTLRPGEIFEVSDDLGKRLLEKLPRTVALAESAVSEKAVRPKNNKAESAPKNKSKGA